MRLKTLNDIDVRNKIVLMRVDFNIEINASRRDKEDKPTRQESIPPWEEFKIKNIFPTLEYLLKRRARIILISHRGRPRGVDASLSLEPIVEHFKGMLGSSTKPVLQEARSNIYFASSIYQIRSDILKPGVIVVAENIRFQRGEELGDLKFAKALAEFGDVFVNDAFSVVHDNHASISKLPALLPSCAGFALQKEHSVLSQMIRRPRRPFSVVLAGGKADTKFPLLKEFLHRADFVFVGGVLANTMFAAAGYPIGSSLIEKKCLTFARPFVDSPRHVFLHEGLREPLILDFDQAYGKGLRKIARRLLLPFDVGVGIIDKQTRRNIEVGETMKLQPQESILDAGIKSSQFLSYLLKRSGEVLWNGPLGYYENQAYESATRAFVDSINRVSTKVLLGGGETLGAFYRFAGKERRNVHVSTGGGAMLEFFLNQKLPGLIPLLR